MKRALFLLIAVFYSLTGFGQESKFLIGVELTPSGSTLWTDASNDIEDTRLAFSSGLKAEYCLTQAFSIKSGLLYELKGEQYTLLYTLESGEQVDRIVKINLNYMILPILITFKTKGSTNFYVDAGTFLGYLLSAKAKYKTGDSKSSSNLGDYYKKFDFGLSIGVGLYIPVSEKYIINIGLKENLGLLNTSKSSSHYYSEKTNSIGFELGLKYKL